MSIGNRIKMLREKQNWTQLQLAEKVGMNNSVLSRIEAGKRPVEDHEIKTFANIFEVTTDYLLTGNQKLEYLQSIVDEIKNRSVAETSHAYQTESLVRIPVLGEIRAGYDLYADQQVIGYELTARENVADGEYFFLKVKGDSMIGDHIYEGHRVLVRRQDWVEEGKIAVVLVNGDEATLKRVYPQDGMAILQSSNPNYPPKIYPMDEVLIQGQVVKVEFDL